MKKIIGYQGDIGSNSEYVAKIFSKENELLVPLINSKNVVSELISGKIDIGVMAIRNTIGGEVIETKQALENLEYILLDTITIPIHHSLFCLQECKKIEVITSHIQALKQTKKYRRIHYCNIPIIEAKDTAIAAKQLSDGILPPTYAVICRKDCDVCFPIYILFYLDTWCLYGNQKTFI